MGRRLCTLAERSLHGRLLGYASAAEFGFEARAFGSPDEARRLAKECDLLVFQEFGKNRTRLVREITKKNPALDVLVIGGPDSPGAISYYEAGATGYVEAGASTEEVLEHVEANGRGETLVDGKAARKLVRRVANLSRALGEREFDPDQCDELTGREREICALLSRGESNDGIGKTLEIAAGTVKSHLHNIYSKLDVDSRHVASALWRIYCEDRDDGGG